MIKAIIFDNFGVLYVKSAKLAFDELSQGDSSLEDQYWSFFRANDRGMITTDEWAKGIGDLFGVTPEKWRSTLKSYDNRNIPLFELVLQLRKDYKTGLFTNLGKGRVKDYYSDEEITKYFDVALASGDIGVAKPDPQAYQLVASRFGVETSEAIFVDDSQPNVDGAKDSGMQAILFKDIHQFRNELEVSLRG